MASQQEKAFCVLRFEVSRFVITVQREFRARFRKDAPCRNNITKWYRQFVETGCLCKGKSPGRQLFCVYFVFCYREWPFPKELLSWQMEFNSWTESGRKVSHYDIMCVETLKNQVYHPHVMPMESADSPTHETQFSSYQRFVYNSKGNNYSLLHAWRVSIMLCNFFSLY